MTQRIQLRKQVNKVLWERAKYPALKLNADDRSLGNLVRSGAGDNLSSYRGEIIRVSLIHWGTVVTMQPHGKTVPIGIQWCMDNIISKIELESDSQQLIYTSKNKFTIPWQNSNSADQDQGVEQ